MNVPLKNEDQKKNRIRLLMISCVIASLGVCAGIMTQIILSGILLVFSAEMLGLASVIELLVCSGSAVLLGIILLDLTLRNTSYVLSRVMRRLKLV